MIKIRWLSLLVENDVGVLARIAGLFSGKSYNLNSLTVGETEDKTISRMTISLTSDDRILEQVIKQLNRSIEVIRVVDITESPMHCKELMFLEVTQCSGRDMEELFRLVQTFHATVIDYRPSAAIVQCVESEEQNNAFAGILMSCFPNRVHIVRGGGVGVEALLKDGDDMSS